MVHPLGVASLPAGAFLTALAIIGCIFAGHLIGSLGINRRLEQFVPAPALGAGLAAQFLLTQLLIPAEPQPFIYFQF